MNTISGIGHAVKATLLRPLRAAVSSSRSDAIPPKKNPCAQQGDTAASPPDAAQMNAFANINDDVLGELLGRLSFRRANQLALTCTTLHDKVWRSRINAHGLEQVIPTVFDPITVFYFDQAARRKELVRFSSVTYVYHYCKETLQLDFGPCTLRKITTGEWNIHDARRRLHDTKKIWTELENALRTSKPYLRRVIYERFHHHFDDLRHICLGNIDQTSYSIKTANAIKKYVFDGSLSIINFIETSTYEKDAVLFWDTVALDAVQEFLDCEKFIIDDLVAFYGGLHKVGTEITKQMLVNKIAELLATSSGVQYYYRRGLLNYERMEKIATDAIHATGLKNQDWTLKELLKMPVITNAIDNNKITIDELLNTSESIRRVLVQKQSLSDVVKEVTNVKGVGKV